MLVMPVSMLLWIGWMPTSFKGAMREAVLAERVVCRGKADALP